MSVQIIVLSVSEKRQALIHKQFKELNIQIPYSILIGFTPQNSAEYLSPELTPLQKGHVCCARGHIKAIKQAADDLSPDFTIIMEDDAALHITKFEQAVNEIAQRWDNLMPSDSHMLSIGWLPHNNYLLCVEALPSDNSLECLPQSKLTTRLVYGAQAYMIKKTSAQKFLPIMEHDTYAAFKKCILEHPSIRKNQNHTYIDQWLNFLLNQRILFPPIVIEQKVESIAGISTPGGNQVVWDKYFKGAESEIKNYWSF